MNMKKNLRSAGKSQIRVLPPGLKKLTEALATNLKRQINIQIVLNKDLIGGAVIQAGDMVIDNSVRGKLNKLADSLNT